MKVAAFVIILLCDVVWGKREAESSHERYVSSTRQSRGQSPGSAPQQALSHESGQSVRYVTDGPQAVNYAGSPFIFRNPLTYSGSNSAASPNTEEQLHNYDSQAFAASFDGKDTVQAKQQASYSPASDVSQFRYSSPLVKYSNLGVISQVTGDEALKSLQKSSAESSQQSRYPSQYLTQSQGYRSVPQTSQDSSESYASTSAASSQSAQQPSSSGQQLQGEEPTSYDALLSQYYAQQQQQHQKQQAQQHQLQLQQQQQLQQYQESSALPKQYSKAVQTIPAHLLQQGSQGAPVRSQYSVSGLPARAKGTSPSGGKSPGFAEQIAQFLGHFTLGSRGNSYASPQAVASGPQKFNNEVISQQRSIPSEQLSKQQQQYFLQQSSRAGLQKQAYPGAVQAQQQQPVYQFVPAGYSAGQQQLQYSKYSQQEAGQSPESQQVYSVGPQGGYIFGSQGGAHPNSVYASSPQGQGAAASQAAYTEGQRAAAAQVLYTNVAPQSEYSSSPSQTIQYVPAHRAAAGASGRSQLQSAASSHSAYA